ncbi:MAG: RluA family pseudouridine synthase [Pirellulales bacterium]|nr:RluA family pseudouridine synthase [Pirellulales bacterium]
MTAGADSRPSDDAFAADPPAADAAAADPRGAGLERYALVVPETAAGVRLDAFLAGAIESVSRSRIRRAIDGGLAAVNGEREKASYRLSAGERVEVRIPAVAEGPLAEPTPIDVLYEDEAIVVVNKPPGMVVHPAKGHWAGTLAGALVYRFEHLSGVGGAVRPGIVHRLDRDTSGVIVAAKTDAAHAALAEQFHNRAVTKEYLAIVAGRPDRDADRVVEPIGPHPTHREKMALRGDHPESRAAETFFEVVERFPGFALVRAAPKTGRTHQIRLHLVHLRCPVLCDKQYGSRSRITVGEVRAITRHKDLAPGLAGDAVLLDRQALHAHRLSVVHPTSGERVTFEAPLAADMGQMLAVLRQTAGG